MIDAVIRALGMALAMGWEILWPLILGFALSAVVQAVVSKRQMSQLLLRREAPSTRNASNHFDLRERVGHRLMPRLVPRPSG